METGTDSTAAQAPTNYGISVVYNRKSSELQQKLLLRGAINLAHLGRKKKPTVPTGIVSWELILARTEGDENTPEPEGGQLAIGARAHVENRETRTKQEKRWKENSSGTAELS